MDLLPSSVARHVDCWRTISTSPWRRRSLLCQTSLRQPRTLHFRSCSTLSREREVGYRSSRQRHRDLSLCHLPSRRQRWADSAHASAIGLMRILSLVAPASSTALIPSDPATHREERRSRGHGEDRHGSNRTSIGNGTCREMKNHSRI